MLFDSEPAIDAALPWRVPPWARDPTGTDALFHAGAALAGLDALVRAEPPFLGVLRGRLALRAAATGSRLLGLPTDAQTLRDAWLLRTVDPPSDALGRMVAAWRRLPGPHAPETLAAVADLLGAPARVGEAVWGVFAEGDPSSSPLRAAAAIADRVSVLDQYAEPFALWLADTVLAQRMGWKRPLPLLATVIFDPALRRGAEGQRPRPNRAEWPDLATAAYALAAAQALDLAHDLARRAARLAATAPKLRAKAAGRVLALLHEEEAITASTAVPGLSGRGLRRLVERLSKLGVLREFSGRVTCRTYGL